LPGKGDIDATDIDLGLDLLGRMLKIRFFEDEVQRLFTRGLVRGTTHLCNGQEAVSVGACSVLRPGDSMTCTYRGHGAVLAMGAPIDETFGEIMGKQKGLCGGKGGSMHLTDVRVGAYGAYAIVGAHLPVTVGLAFASRYQDTGDVGLCFFGDGTVNIGAFHEALNLASVWKLPALFILENNLYGEYSTVASTTPIARLVDRASAYGMAGVRVDGNEVFAVREVVSDALERARSGEGPTLIEAMTYRQVGHSRSDPANYRPPGELEEWLERDPIKILTDRLLQSGVLDQRITELRESVEATVLEALEIASSWEAPKPEDRLTSVLA